MIYLQHNSFCNKIKCMNIIISTEYNLLFFLQCSLPLHPKDTSRKFLNFILILRVPQLKKNLVVHDKKKKKCHRKL